MSSKKWTKEEIAFVKKHRSRNIRWLAKSLKRTYASVANKMSHGEIEKPKVKGKKIIAAPYSKEDELGGLTLEDVVEKLRLKGYKVDVPRLKTDDEFKIPLKKTKKVFKFGAMSDPHLGSQYQQLTHLHSFYQYCSNEGIDTIFNAGDVCEGNGKLYRGQVYEMFKFGTDNQGDYIVKNYPKIPGIKTYMIGGSHDYSFFKTDGYDILKMVADQRKDISYLGYAGAYVNVNGVRIYLHHPSGGVPYARSYRMQKLIEQIAPENKPNIILSGHLHVPAYVPGYRNVEGFQLGCFQAQTPYLKAKGLFPWIAGLIVTVEMDKDGFHSVSSKWVPYYVPIKKDY